MEHNLRGQFITDARGEYAFYCIKPTPYPVPTDGPGGKLLHLMDRQIMRPAHIHLMVSITFSRCSVVFARMTQSVILSQIHLTARQVRKEGYQPMTTQIYDADSDFLENDAVFAVKGDLVVKFVPRAGDTKAKWELNYDVLLAKQVTKSRL